MTNDNVSELGPRLSGAPQYGRGGSVLYRRSVVLYDGYTPHYSLGTWEEIGELSAAAWLAIENEPYTPGSVAQEAAIAAGLLSEEYDAFGTPHWVVERKLQALGSAVTCGRIPDRRSGLDAV